MVTADSVPRPRVLVTLAQGYGNVVFAMPLVSALARLGFAVDTLYGGPHPDAHDLMALHPDVTVSMAGQLPRPPGGGWGEGETNARVTVKKYAASNAFPLAPGLSRREREINAYAHVVRTAWHRAPLGLPNEVFPDELDLTLFHEAEMNLTAAWKLGFDGETPTVKLRPPSSMNQTPPPAGRGLGEGASTGTFAHSETTVPNVSALTPTLSRREREKPPRRVILLDPAPRDAIWAKRSYPHMPEVAARLLAGGFDVALLGSRTDKSRWHDYDPRVRRIATNTILDAVRELTTAACVVGQDCGLLHIASALGVPVAGLFGPTSEIKNRPLGLQTHLLMTGADCRPCQHHAGWHDCAGAWCMKSLSPAMVANAGVRCSVFRVTTRY